MMDFRATMSVRVAVRFPAPVEGPHIASGDDRHDGEHDREHDATVYENRTVAARYAENQIAQALRDALGALGAVLDVTVEEVAEAPR